MNKHYTPTVPHRWQTEHFLGIILPKPRKPKAVSVMKDLPPLTQEDWERAKEKAKEQK